MGNLVNHMELMQHKVTRTRDTAYEHSIALMIRILFTE